MPLSNRQADAARDALLQEPRGYLGSGSSHPWWIHGASLGVGITQIVWRRRHKA
jgi:hypothetical protein